MIRYLIIVILSIVLLVNTNSLLTIIENKDLTIEQLRTQVAELVAELKDRELKNFSSVDELNEWLSQDKSNYYTYERQDFNCIDFAFLLQQNALEDGYLMNIEVLPIGAHFVNSVVIDDVLYVIEPQNDEIIISKELKHGG